ncbi:MAG: radical SAM protein, partial [Thermoguttaceae bacterium]
MTDVAQPLFGSHPRDFQDNLYVYPVLSRRAGGISIGVNLNRDKFCNFQCVYCQSARNKGCKTDFIDMQRLHEELDATVELVVSKRIFQKPQF